MAGLEELLDPGYPGPLDERDLAELRSMRSECQEVETGLSMLRRVVQGHLDIVGEEVRRRDEGAAAGDLADLIDRLPGLLSDRTHAPGVGRLSQMLAPEAVDPGLQAQLDALVGTAAMTELGSLDVTALTGLAAALEAFERTVSDHRRALFDRIDALQEEIARRYRSGEASVDSLLT